VIALSRLEFHIVRTCKMELKSYVKPVYW
jgi:hypothetical protein